MKGQGQRDKLLSLFPGQPPSTSCLCLRHVGTVAWALLAVEEPGKCCPNKLEVLLIRKEGIDIGWATGLNNLTFQCLPVSSNLFSSWHLTLSEITLFVYLLVCWLVVSTTSTCTP